MPFATLIRNSSENFLIACRSEVLLQYSFIERSVLVFRTALAQTATEGTSRLIAAPEKVIQLL